MPARKMNQPNQGIRCAVNTCHYYMSGDHCSAEKIEVHSTNASNLRNASSSQETNCATFMPQGK